VESVQELVQLNVPELMEASRLAVGIVVDMILNVEPVPTIIPAIFVVVTELASVFLTVIISNVVMMVVVDHVELVQEEASVKDPLIPIQDNATSIVILI